MKLELGGLTFNIKLATLNVRKEAVMLNIQIYGWPEDRERPDRITQTEILNGIIRKIRKILADKPYRSEVVLTWVDSTVKDLDDNVSSFLRVYMSDDNKTKDLPKLLNEELNINVEVVSEAYFLPQKQVNQKE